ncbi:hypothetical protein [Streptomyces coffeae]|uniref:Uncharacterized protein n=1 Tax=Streptomyces coffeae TaxID=621382 RepID=A0ABS1NK50_9ACTN|nr:hypothetical protein [Streptomyces coffeae]MBL1100151.1 hypothetical protein [Streptomyces coffeae]
MAFPDLRVEIQVGDTWTDVTGDTFTRRQQVSISRGRRDEAARSDPARCQVGLNNKDGRYSPKNPRSPLYGLIGRNTPLRVTVAGQTPRLVLDGSLSGVVSTPDTAPLDIIGDIDLRAEVEIDWTASDLNQVLIGKWDGATNQRSYALRVLDQQLLLSWSENGVAVLVAAVTLPTLPDRCALRATLDADNGTGGRTVTFYWARSTAGPWTQIGNPVVQTTATSIYSGTAPLLVGSPDATTNPPRVPFTGSGYRFEVRSGINGTVVASPDFTAVTPGAASFTDATGHVWTLAGTATVTNRLTRFVGEVSSWPSRWGVSGKDVWVPLEASGITRRLGQGVKPLASTLRRRIPAEPALLAYWPMEEEREATQAYSPMPGVQPMVVDGIEFASDDTLAGSSALPKVSTAGAIGAQVPVGPDGAWRVECVYKLSDYPAVAATILEVRTTGTYATLRIEARPSNVRLYGITSTGVSTIVMNIAPTALFTGAWNRLQLRASTSGGSTTFHCNWITIGVQERGLSTVVPGVTAGHVTSVQCAPGAGIDQRDLSMGHLAVMSVVQSTIYDLADEGFAGETAHARMRRLCQEEGVPLVISGAAQDTPAMGPQRPATLLDLLGQAADTDGGILGEQRDRLALRYRTRTSLYSQPPALALDYQGPGLAPPLEPQDDDAEVRNDVTVQRIGGSAARAVLEAGPLSVQPPPAGVGLYDESVSLSLAADDQAEPIAWWRLWMGTQDELRYPSVRVDVAKAPALLAGAAAAVVEGDRLTIANPPPWLPPETIDEIAQGYAESFLPGRWDITYTCTPARPWAVALAADDALTGIVYLADTDGSQLSSPVNEAATTLLVAVTAGPLWPTGGAYLPVDVMLGGERVAITAVSGTSSPQTFTVVRSVNGITKSHAAGTALSLAAPAIAAL